MNSQIHLHGLRYIQRSDSKKLEPQSPSLFFQSRDDTHVLACSHNTPPFLLLPCSPRYVLSDHCPSSNVLPTSLVCGRLSSLSSEDIPTHMGCPLDSDRALVCQDSVPSEFCLGLELLSISASSTRRGTYCKQKTLSSCSMEFLESALCHKMSSCRLISFVESRDSHAQCPGAS